MKFKSLISKFLITTFVLSSAVSLKAAIPAFADSYISVTLGADLSEEQKNQMLTYFKVGQNDANILEVTSKEEYEALGNIASSSQLGTKSISCSYVEPTSSGGLDISTNNLTWVTEGMIKNALITAGIENAKVIAAAPFKVSGTAALTGILKGFENSSEGEAIDEDKKEAANEELFVTAGVGDEIGQDDATNLINDIKKDVIKENPSTQEEIDEIVDDAIKKYDYELSDESKQQIKDLMQKINDLDLDYKSIKDQLNDISDQLKDKINAEAVDGFFAKIGKFFSNLWDKIVSFFTRDDNSYTNTNADEPFIEESTPIDDENSSSNTTEETESTINSEDDNSIEDSTTDTIDSNANDSTLENSDLTNTESN